MSADNNTSVESPIEKRPPHETQLYVSVEEWKWPIVYDPQYNIGFLGLEKLHPFDAGKWGRVYKFLKDDNIIQDDTTVRPREASEQDLLVVHKKSYLESLKWSLTVAGITEVPPVAILPNFIVQKYVLKPFRYHTGGTILAAKLAMERGWGINIGGGFHHCSSDRGGGFCAYADITLAILFLFERNPKVTKAMIIDLDAHQGNGHERDFMNDDRVYIMDVYNRGIYPHDGFAKRAIKRKVELGHLTKDDEYLNLVESNIEDALNEFQTDIIVYNAGTDILEGDPLGCLSITPKGIIQRDEIVFEKARKRGIPVLMVTSGGYQKTTARIIADSIINLKTKGLISCQTEKNCPPSPRESSIPSSDRNLISWFKGFIPSSSTPEFQSKEHCTSHKTTVTTTGASDCPGQGLQ
ncbi:hypothetical protein CHS0354_035683 [Potamilus streckersoni]|uniref:Histone deacetylase 11 n=1 Tax=Potamilus streckersoni TaxID=2493646 RepID=A0AAE0VJ95_9BIVA|nr:hypothetical protein CHS0354_035683 [Potamilus streckersoni]